MTKSKLNGSTDLLERAMRQVLTETVEIAASALERDRKTSLGTGNGEGGDRQA